MMKAVSDRRCCPRHNLKTLLRVRIWKSEAPEERGESVNLSERGIFFTTKLPLDLATTVEFLLKMPQEISDEAEPSRRWTGHVVRVVPANVPGGRLGVGVQFDCYETVQGLVIEELRGATSRQAQNLS